MTSSVLLGLLIAATTVLYWMLCRKRSLLVQASAVKLLSALYANDEVSDSEKSTAHFNYLLVQRWWYVPLLVAFMPIFLAFSLIFNRNGLPKPTDGSSLQREAMDCVMMIYITRHPITSALSFTAILLMAMPVILVGLLLNRIKSLPSITMTAAMVSAIIVENIIRPSKGARAH